MRAEIEKTVPFSAVVLSKDSFLARMTGAGDFSFAVSDVFLLLVTGIGDVLTSCSAGVVRLQTAASSNALESIWKQ